jgi:hypothetical protein
MPFKVLDEIPLQDALDNFTLLASLSADSPPLLGILQGKKLVIDQGDFPASNVRWIGGGEGAGPLLDIFDASCRAVSRHLLLIAEKRQEQESGAQKALSALMGLIGEAAKRLTAYFEARGISTEGALLERTDLVALKHFYDRRIAKKSGKREAAADIEGARADLNYELFYIRNEAGEPYYDFELLKQIRLSADFQTAHFEEDPLLRIRAMEDRDLQRAAQQILDACHPLIAQFFQMRPQGSDLGKYLAEAIFALMLAANPHNLIQNTQGKSALVYFTDFQKFLREALQSGDYTKWIAYPPPKNEKGALLLLDLAHQLAYAFFHHPGGIRQEAIGLIHRSARRGLEKRKLKKGGEESIWGKLMREDEEIRTLLAAFPNGPLFKVLDLIQEAEEREEIIPFDPILQENFPHRLYAIEAGKKKLEVLHLPSPTRQTHIDKAEVDEEFIGMLRAQTQLGKRHLLVQLQDRTSWQELARIRALDAVAKKAEFTETLAILTLPKNTPFYLQTDPYEEASSADLFFAALRDQIASGEEYGYTFPHACKSPELLRFVDALLPLIHLHLFDNRKELTREMRQDAIELFYQFLLLKVVDLIKPDSLSFTCKDGLDTGAAAAASLYAFLSLIQGEFSDSSVHDQFRYLLYTPALFIRERAVHATRAHRALSSLSRLDEAGATTLYKKCSSLYQSASYKISPPARHP